MRSTVGYSFLFCAIFGLSIEGDAGSGRGHLGMRGEQLGYYPRSSSAMGSGHPSLSSGRVRREPGTGLADMFSPSGAMNVMDTFHSHASKFGTSMFDHNPIAGQFLTAASLPAHHHTVSVPAVETGEISALPPPAEVVAERRRRQSFLNPPTPHARRYGSEFRYQRF